MARSNIFGKGTNILSIRLRKYWFKFCETITWKSEEIPANLAYLV